MNIKILKINKPYIKYFMCLLPFFLSSVVYTQIIPAFANILLVAKMVIFISISLRYCLKYGISKLDIAILLYAFIWGVSVFINRASLIDYVKEIVVIFAIVFIIEEAFKEAVSSQMLKAMRCILFFELLINLMGLIIFPEGLWQTVSTYGMEAKYTFLGLDNQVSPILIIAELMLFFKIQEDNFKIKPFSVLFAIILVSNIALMMSATGLVGCIIIFIIGLIGFMRKSYINLRFLLILVAIIFIAVVVFRVQSLFSFFIEYILKKDLTLSSRTGIWDRAIILITQSPIIGYGCGTLSAIVGDRNAHDFYLQIILQSGFVGIIIYLNIFRVSLKKCFRKVNDFPILIISATLCGYLICCISEVYTQSWLFILLTLAYSYSSQYFINCKKTI